MQVVEVLHVCWIRFMLAMPIGWRQQLVLSVFTCFVHSAMHLATSRLD